MARSAQLSDLMSRRFLRELHHFLWTEPSLCEGGVDAGWNCRDHALVAAFLAQSLGYKPLLYHGEAFFAKGATGKSGSVSYHQKPHAWLVIENVGATDLSVKPELDSAGEHYHLPVACIYANEWIPRGKGSVFFAEDAQIYAQAAETLLQRRNHASAVYLVREAEYFHAGHLDRAAGFAGSPLTRLLDATYGNPSDLYAALMLHLHAFLEGRAQSLSALTFDQAWRKIATGRDQAIERARLHVEAKADVPSQRPADAAMDRTQALKLGLH